MGTGAWRAFEIINDDIIPKSGYSVHPNSSVENSINSAVGVNHVEGVVEGFLVRVFDARPEQACDPTTV
jgi:hypothetical protein